MIYLIFNEGYAATAGDDLIRPALCAEAQRLGRILAGLMPRGARGARPAGADGNPGLAPRRPHGAGRRLRAADRAEPRALGPAADPARASPRWPAPRRSAAATALYVLQAALAACHARARRADEPTGRASPRSTTGCASSCPRPWSISIARSPTAWPSAPKRACALLDAIADAAALRHYAPLPAARGDFLFRAGRLAEARVEFEAAAALTRNCAERAFLLARADACEGKH